MMEQSLFERFSPISREQWEQAIEKTLGGGNYRQQLLWKTGEGIKILPFYRREDLETLPHTGIVPSPKGARNSWSVRQPIFESKPAKANRAALAALEYGAEALQYKLRIQRAEGMIGGDLKGAVIQSQQDFSELLRDVPLDLTGIHFDTGMTSPVLLAMIFNCARDRDLDPADIDATLLYDPFAYVATRGHLPKKENRLFDEAEQMTTFSLERFGRLRCLGVDARTYRNAGGHIVEELALALSTASEYLARLTEAGISAGDIASQIHFSLAIGSNYFPEIAKFRALRLLWDNIVTAYGAEVTDATRAYLHAESCHWNKTVYDPHTNILRTTTEGISAAIAGCDSITLYPFDHASGRNSDLATRLARNTQLILKEEAHLDHVKDPGAGSYYIEVLTDRIAKESWKLFQKIENQGGMLKALANGTVHKLITQSAGERAREVAKRSRALVGTNRYPNPEERGQDDPLPEPGAISLSESDLEIEIDELGMIDSLAELLRKGAHLGDIIPRLENPGKQQFRPIGTRRAAEPFERLRRATERHNPTPSVFTLPMGDRKKRQERSAFAVNFLGCAGYEIVDHIGFDRVEEAIKEVRETQPEMVVICSSDREYRDLVEPICKQLETLERPPIAILAGGAKKDFDFFKDAGIDMIIDARSNMLETLRELHRKLGINSKK